MSVSRREPPPVQEGEVVPATIEALPLGPDSVARARGYVLFVPGGIPGERVRVRVTATGRRYGRGEVVSVEAPSGDRAPPFCPYFLRCGGCHLQHLAPEARRRAKRSLLRLTLERALGRDIPVSEAEPGPERRYRAKVVVTLGPRAGGIEAGLYRLHSRELIAIEDCPVQNEAATRLALGLARALEAAGASAWDERTGEGEARHILVRAGEGSGELDAVVAVRRPGPFPWQDALAERARALGATGLSLNTSPPPERDPADPSRPPRDLVLGPETVRLFGPERYRTTIEGLDYLVSPVSFFQTNPDGAATIVRTSLRLLGDVRGKRLLDVYGGVGLVALQAARRGARPLVVEGNPASIADGRATAEGAGLTCSFRRGRAEDLLPRLAREGSRFELAVVDPPREGCHPRVLEALVRGLATRTVVYVSCEPETLARDLAVLEGLGLRTDEVVPVDMFPHAYHIEAVARLVRP